MRIVNEAFYLGNCNNEQLKRITCSKWFGIIEIHLFLTEFQYYFHFAVARKISLHICNFQFTRDILCCVFSNSILIVYSDYVSTCHVKIKISTIAENEKKKIKTEFVDFLRIILM